VGYPKIDYLYERNLAGQIIGKCIAVDLLEGCSRDIIGEGTSLVNFSSKE
jgi:hypothetical protein